MTSNFKSMLMSGGAFGGMTANERRLGRFIRDGEGHPAPAPAAPAPAPEAPAQAEDLSASDDFSAFERGLDGDAGDDDGSGNVEPATPEDDDGNPGEPPAPEKPEGASVQERIDELTAARREAEREAAEARRELEELRRAQQPPKVEVNTRGEGEAPNPDDYEFGEADSRYIADTATFHAEQTFQRLQREAEAKAQLTEVESRWAGAIADAEVVQQYLDFAEKVTEGASKGTWDCSPLMALMIKGSEVGPHIAYHLATNAAESKRIAGMVPIEQALEIGRLEGRIAAERATKPAPAARVASNAPPPPPRTRGAGGKFTVEADTDDFAAFDKHADSLIRSK